MNPSIVDTVLSHLDDPQLAQIAARLGTTPDQARNAIEHAVPLIVGGMARNAQTPGGADALHTALGDHVGQNIGGLLGGLLGSAGTSGIGGAILGHIFGPSQPAANQGLGQATGLDSGRAGQLLAMLAPLVMAALANHVQRGGIDPGALGGMLNQQSQSIQQQGGVLGGLLSSVLGGGGGVDMSSLLRGLGRG